MSTHTDEQGAKAAQDIDTRGTDAPAPEQPSPPAPRGEQTLLPLVPTITHPPRPTSGPVLAIRPNSLEEVWRMATAAVKGGFAPKGMSIEGAVSAIIMGSELGIPAMAALQSIAVINGRPSLFGDGALGVIRASGRLEYIREIINEERMIASCLIKREGEPALTRKFSQADAEKADLWGKAGPWTSYPKRMLQMRARAFAMRDAFADILKGFGIAEEMQDVAPAAVAEAPLPVVGK